MDSETAEFEKYKNDGHAFLTGESQWSVIWENHISAMPASLANLASTAKDM